MVRWVAVSVDPERVVGVGGPEVRQRVGQRIDRPLARGRVDVRAVRLRRRDRHVERVATRPRSRTAVPTRDRILGGVGLGACLRPGFPSHPVPTTHPDPGRPLHGQVRGPRRIRERVRRAFSGVEPLVHAPGASLGVTEVVEPEARRPQHHACPGDDARPQVVDVGRVGAHVAAVHAEHDGRRGRRQEPVGPDGRVRAGEAQPADRVDARVDLADQVDRELVACRRDRPEAQLLTRRVGSAHPGGQPPGERPPGLGSRDLRAHRRGTAAAVPAQGSAPRRRSRGTVRRHRRPLPLRPVTRRSRPCRP